MNEHNDLSYTFYVIAPFNSRMIINNLNLIGKYEDFRKLMYKKLSNKYPEQVLIEKIGDATKNKQAIQNWLGEVIKTPSQDEDIRLFKRTGESGVTQKDKSIITMVMNEDIELSIDVLGPDIFTSAPRFVFESMSFHEYGVGTVYCRLDVNFTQHLLKMKENQPKEFIADFLEIISTYPALLKATESIGNDVYKAYLEVSEELLLKAPFITYEDLFGDQKSSTILWGHIVLVRNDLSDKQESEVNDLLENIIAISHPQGSVDFAEGTDGYVHIGWGNSLWTGLNEIELIYAKEILRYVEIEWRTLQVFNDILYKRLNQFASHKKLHKKSIKETMVWINTLRMEMELYSLDRSNYLQNLAPFAFFIYNETVESWRISQMSDFFKEKLEVFEYLHSQGKDALNEISDSRINNILFIFTCLSLVSTFIDGLTFVSADNIAELLPLRLFLLIFPPIAFIILIIVLISRFNSAKKLRRK